MRARMLELAGRLDELAATGTPAPGSDPADDPAEAAALLRWLADGNFVFLGARDVDLLQSRGKPASRAVAGTGQGVLRSDTDMTTSVVWLPEAARAPRHHLLTVTKADARSPVHRRAWLDLVAVSLPSEHGARQHRLRRAVPVGGVLQQRARHAARAAAGGRGHHPLRCAARQPHRQGAAGGPRDLSARRAAAGRGRRAAAGRAGRAAPAGTPPDPPVPSPRPDQPVLVGAGLPAAGPVHDRGAAGHAAAAAGAAGRHERRVHGPIHGVAAGPAALRRPRAGDQARHPRADVGRRRGAAGRARGRRPQLDRRSQRRTDRPVRRRGGEDARPGGRRLPGRLPGGLLRRAGRRRPRAARQPARG